MMSRAPRPADRSRPWLASTRGILLCVALALLLALPSLRIGFYMDDHSMINIIEGRYEAEAAPFNLYASFLDQPGMPWWLSPATRLAFWRPLTSATLRLDYALFGHQAVNYHLHSLIWLAALVGVTGLLYRRLSPTLAAVALLVFAVDETHAYTSGIICNRHAVVATVLALGGLHAHLRWREEGWRAGLPLSLLGFSLACLAGETALAVMAYALAYELFAGPGDLRRRLGAIAPAAALAVVYLVAYKAMGYGPREMVVYNDPVGDPARYLAGVLMSLPVFMAGIVAAVPVGLMMTNPVLVGPFVLLGVVALVATLWGWRKIRPLLSEADRRALDWLVPGAFGALLPTAAAPPSERMFLVPAVGLIALLAAFAAVAWRRWRDTAASRRSRLMAAGTVMLLAALHLGLAPYSRISKQLTLARTSATLEHAAASVEEYVPVAAEDHQVVVVATEGFLTLTYPPAIYDMRHPHPVSWGVLSAAPFEHRLTRTAARTLELEPIGGEFLGSLVELVFRPPGSRLAVGDVIADRRFEVEVLAANDKGPTRLAFHFHHDLDSPRMSYVVWEAGRFRQLALPEIGESLTLPVAAPALGLP